MTTFDDRIAARQAELIDELRDKLRVLEARVIKYQKRDKYAQAWLDLCEAVRANETVLDAWEDFLLLLKMGGDETYLKKNGGI